VDFPVVVEREQLALRAHPDADPDEFSFVARVHPAMTATAVAVNYPGFDGSFDGHGGKYKLMAEALQERGVAVMRLENRPTLAFDYNEQLLADLRSAVAWLRRNTASVCFAPDPDLYLVGTSLGATACAALAAELNARKLVLFAPAQRLEAEVAAGLADYRGEIYAVVGEHDDVTGPEAVDWLRGLAWGARFRECLLPGCDHHFSGQERHVWEIPVEVLLDAPPA